MRLAEFSVKNYQFTLVIFLLVMLLGVNALRNMPRGEDPPFSSPIFMVLAIYPGTSPMDMEQLVVEPLEEVLYNLENIKHIQSYVQDGVVAMKVEFTYDVDVDAKNNDIIREVNKVRPTLPEGLLRLDVEKAASSDVTILQTALISETATERELKDYGENLKKEIERIKPIKWVKIQGNRQERVDIKINLERMAQYRLGLNQVLGTIQASNINIPGGSIDIASKQYNINTTSDFDNIEDIRNIVVRTTPEGAIVKLNDIATVSMGLEDKAHIVRFNGKRAIWVASALKDGRNIIQTRAEMQKALDSFEPTLPKHIRMEHAFDQAKSVENRLSGLGRDFAIAIFLVLLTLLPLGFRASLVVMISIPLSLSLGLAMLNGLGFTLNQLSIVGLVIALGLLVDDSIVVVENIERFMRMGYSKKEAAFVATKQIGVAVIGCTATLIFAFLPLAFLPEGAGQFIRSLPMAVLLTILASLFVSLTIIPFLSSILLKNHEQNDEGNIFLRGFKKYINRPYQKILEWSFRHPVLALVGIGLIFFSSLLLIPKLGFSLFPFSEKPMFNVDIEAPAGTNLTEMNRITRKIEQRIQQYPQVKSVSTNVGFGNPRVYYNEFQRSQSQNFAQLLVQVDNEMHVPQIAAFCDTLRNEFETFAGAKVEVKRFKQGVPIPAPIEMRIIGENVDTLKHYANKVEDLLKTKEGTMYVRNALRLPKTELKIKINKEKAGLLGVLPAEIAKTIRLGIAGLTVGNLKTENGDDFDINVGVENASQEQVLQKFDKLYITSLSGALIPLNQIAEIELAESPNVIRHYNKERYTIVTAFVESNINALAMIAEIEKDLEKIPLPRGYRYVAAGEKESQQESFGGMATIVMIAVFALFAILVLEFRTFKSTLIVLSVVPLGIVGAILILFIVGESLSFVATIGMVALVGIEIKNSILLVDYTNHLRENGMPLREAIMDGAETRFLPILLTSLTAIGGLIPIVLETSPLISPLAWVLIGGLISSTLLSRIVTPLLYWLIPPKVTLKEKK